MLYLPGVSRQDLRVVESCPDYLKPLVELQYRGVIWSQINAKDWTILAFLKSDQGGLGLVGEINLGGFPTGQGTQAGNHGRTGFEGTHGNL